MSVQPPPFPAGEGWSTPPGNLAGFGQRLIARIIDSVIVAVPLIAIFATTRASAGFNQFYLFNALLYAVSFLNDVMLTAAKGGTVGKLIVGTRVVGFPDGLPVTGVGAARRWAALSVMGFIPFLGLVDDLWIFTGQTRQTLHDKFAKTVVVRKVTT